MVSKQWGKKKFWGLGPEFDYDFNYSESQLQYRDKIIELCKTTIRPIGIKCDKTYEYPTASIKALAKLNATGLIIPKEFGGLGESNVFLLLILETVARYGCPSTAMALVMHYVAVSALLCRYHNNEEIKTLFRRICKEGNIGTASFSDPAAGGHFWYALSSKCQKLDNELYKVYKYISWSTSAGYADFYVQQSPNPESCSDFENFIMYIVYKNEMRTSSYEWSTLGMHGNHAGSLLYEGILPKSRVVGRPEEGLKITMAAAISFFNLCTSAVWNGLSMACIDLAKKHTTTKTHGDSGLRVAEYPIIQDYVGESLCQTNACRGFLHFYASQMDKLTENNNWELYTDPNFFPLINSNMWGVQIKYSCSENVAKVSDMMLRTCGGDGFKTDLGLERLLRDSKAAIVMGTSNEVIKSQVGKEALLGLGTFDLWNKTVNEKTVRGEINKMTLEEKKELLSYLTDDVTIEEKKGSEKQSYHDIDFDNPFNTSPPKSVMAFKTSDGVEHNPALNPVMWTELKLISKTELNNTMKSFVFAFPSSTDHSGCLVGQYIQIRIKSEGCFHERYFSPVSPPNHFGSIELIVKLETNGIVSNVLENLEIGEKIEFRGPLGGFEYEPNSLKELTIIAAGAGVTPAIQLVRSVVMNSEDELKLNLIYYSKDIEEIIYQQELEDIAKKDFRISPIIVLGEAPEKWEHEEGFVDQEMIDKYVTKPNGQCHKIVMCGGPLMTISCLHSFRSLKFPPEMIFIYGQFGTAQIRAVYGRNAKLCGHKSSSNDF